MNNQKRQTLKSIAAKRRALRNAARALSVGLGSCLAVTGHYYSKRANKINLSWERKGVRSDAEALRSDWYKVGKDIRNSINSSKDNQSQNV